VVGVGVAVEQAVAAVVVVGVTAVIAVVVAGVIVVRVVVVTGLIVGRVTVVPVIVTFSGPMVMAGRVVVMAVARMAAVTGLGVRIACHFVPVATSGRPLATL
jgi:hypothetical protein